MSDRKKRLVLSEGPTNPQRPQIWVEGRQRPKFDTTAYGAACLGVARRDLLPAMLETEAGLAAFGQKVAAGEVRLNLAWAGRAQRLVPGHRRVGGWILGLAALFADASRHLGHVDDGRISLAYPDLARTETPKPAAPRALVTEEPTLLAIRTAMLARDGEEALEPGAKRPELARKGTADAPGVTAILPAWARAILRAGVSRGLLAVLMAFALPVGAIKAMIHHLAGGDLADWP